MPRLPFRLQTGTGVRLDEGADLVAVGERIKPG